MPLTCHERHVSERQRATYLIKWRNIKNIGTLHYSQKINTVIQNSFTASKNKYAPDDSYSRYSVKKKDKIKQGVLFNQYSKLNSQSCLEFSTQTASIGQLHANLLKTYLDPMYVYIYMYINKIEVFVCR